MNIPYFRTMGRLGCAIAAMALLTGCNSVLTGISAPASVAPGETFEVVVTHEFTSGSPIPGDFTESALAFGMLIPNGWTINPGSRYVGNWDGNNIELDLVEQPLPSNTNFIDLVLEFEADGDLSEEEEELFRTLDCKNLIDILEVTPDTRFVYLQSTPSPLPDVEIQENDGGEFQISMTAAGPGGSKGIAAIHGLYFAADDVEVGEGDQTEIVDMIGCVWYPESDDEPSPEDDFITPSNVEALITQTGSSTPVAIPVPLGGGPFAALMALLLLGAGLLVGRRLKHI